MPQGRPTMDERLPLGSPDAATLRVLLEKERERTHALEHKVARLKAGLARQNARIVQQQRQAREREEEGQQLGLLVAGLKEQNGLLRKEVALLHQENARLLGTPLAPSPAAAPESKPATLQCEKKVWKRRAPEQNAGRRKTEQPNRWVDHAVEQCPGCGEQLMEGWFHRRVVVIDLPPVAPLEITKHQMIRRQCPKCGKRVPPRPVGNEGARVGCCRFGPWLIAAIATMATVERLPGRMIQERLQREYGLMISHGGIWGLLQRMAKAGTSAYEQLRADIRGSPVVYVDETSWRENGQHTTVWTASMQHTVYVHHGRRANEAIDGILGEEFAGTIGCDCYAAYDHFLGPKQRSPRGPRRIWCAIWIPPLSLRLCLDSGDRVLDRGDEVEWGEGGRVVLHDEGSCCSYRHCSGHAHRVSVSR